MTSTKLQCKVKIGSSYEPKWFEKRQTQGTYSGKNVPLDEDAMWLQNALIGKGVARLWKTKIATTVGCIAVGFYVLHIYGLLF